MKRVLVTSVMLSTLVLAGCASSTKSSTASTAGGSSPATSSSGATTTATPTTAPLSSTATTTPSAGSGSAAAGGSSSTTPNQALAAKALLTASDLPGWTVQPTGNSNNSNNSNVNFQGPACADLEALDNDPALQDQATVDLASPDKLGQLEENVTVADPAATKRAFDTFAAPTTAGCLQAVFTTLLQQPGTLPEGVTLAGLQFQQQPLQAGQQAISYVGTVTLTGANTGTSLAVGVRFDAILQAGDIGLLITITQPGAAAIDPTMIATAAAKHLSTTSS